MVAGTGELEDVTNPVELSMIQDALAKIDEESRI